MLLQYVPKNALKKEEEKEKVYVSTSSLNNLQFGSYFKINIIALIITQ